MSAPSVQPDCAPRRLTVGVAGHVDHGKTALVRALTGIETDRLKEEQERGMSIVLGFAHLSLAPGIVNFIDVPGHERFLKTMICGASGIDCLLLAIDCREGVMPQSIEHLEIASLLGIRAGIVAMTKADLLEPGDRRKVEAAARAEVAGTLLEGAPFVFTSAATGDGLDTLVAAIEERLLSLPERASGPYFYLPIDRAFTVTGRGCVVTGTLRAGELAAGATVDAGPAGACVMREVQVHGRAVPYAVPGQRVALNLRGIRRDAIARGDVIATPGYLRETSRIDVSLTTLPHAPTLRRGQSAMAHVAGAETAARIYPLAADRIAPGEQTYAQIRLHRAFRVPTGERIVLRGLSPATTIGGALILDTAPPRHSFSEASQAPDGVLALLEALERGPDCARLAARCRFAAEAGVRADRFQRDCRLSADRLEGLIAETGCRRCGGVLVERAVFESLVTRIIDTVTQYHRDHRLRSGIDRDELRRCMPVRTAPEVIAEATAHAVTGGRIDSDGPVLHIAGSTARDRLTDVESRILDEIDRAYSSAGLQPPPLKDLCGSDRRKKALFSLLIEEGIICEIVGSDGGRSVYLHRSAVEDARRGIECLLAEHGPSTVSEIDRALGIPRRISIALLGHFDNLGITVRTDDRRGLPGAPTETL